MLLEILRALECFATEVTLVRLQGYVNANVRGDVVTLDGGGATCAPLAGQVEVVGALATDVAFADVILGWLLASGIATRKKVRLPCAIRRVSTRNTCNNSGGKHLGFKADLHKELRRCRIARRILATGR